MRIVHVAPEMAPYAKVGGLGDVVGALPVAQARSGHDVTVILPGYKRVFDALSGSLREGPVVRYGYGGRDVAGLIRVGDHDGVRLFVVENNLLFARDGIYGTSDSSYTDNGPRFAWFCGAALSAMRTMDPPPDVAVCHDWTTALLPILLRGHPIPGDPLADLATVLVIHNLAHQGKFSAEIATELGLPELLVQRTGLVRGQAMNMLEGGIAAATQVITVSPTYARQIVTAAHGFDLDRQLLRRGDDLTGILNGLDLDAWDPSRDEHIASTFTGDDLAGKAQCKKRLQERAGLIVDASLPLFGMVSRVDPQKGVDLVGKIAPWLVERRAQLVFLGSGQADLLDELRTVARMWNKSVAIAERFDESLAHAIYAGSDYFLMPSRFEPCGLGQMVALRYGTLPIAHNTGGLADTIRDLTDRPEDGNGFLFDIPDQAGLRWACGRALELFANADELMKIRRRAMAEDLSWTRSATRYDQVLAHAIRRERGRTMR